MWRRIFKIRQGKNSLLSFWRSIFLPKQSSSDPSSDVVRGTSYVVRDFRSARRRYALATIIVVGICIFLIASPTHAEEYMSTTVNWIVAIFTKILVYIAELLAYILLQLLDFLIQIVQFNNFVNAAPVRVGWPLIRDTVNMFFIVVVLVSAFATIIGYPKDFHYRQILPKLLIMAILINFSKTLIGLMIDFSQVLVLTFVNGFKDAAGGNFINALHIREAMSIESQAGSVISDDGKGGITVNAGNTDGVATYQIFNMMLAAIFAIWILSLSITLVLIMVIFFLARIIILWFLLITSPVMFFAWSLPGKLQKSFSAFTDQWWNRLSSALIGGPTMAFFLWLSLAMAQGQGGTDSLTGPGASSLYKGQSQEVTSNIQGLTTGANAGNIVVTEIGKSENISNFIIMVAFMLLGVQVAVQSSNALAPKLGSLAKAIETTGGAFGFGVAGAVAAGKVAERGARGAIGGAGGFVNDRYGLSNKLAGAVGKSSWAPITHGMRVGLMQHAGEPKKRAQAKSKEMTAAVAHESPVEAEKFFRRMAKSGNISTQMAGSMGLAGLTGSALFAKKLQKDGEEDARSKIMDSKEALEKYKTNDYSKLDEGQKKEVNAQAEALARRNADIKLAVMQDEARTFAESINDTELIDKINDNREKDPGKQGKINEVEGLVSKIMSDKNGHTKVKDDAYMDSAVFISTMKAKGWMDKDANLTVSESDPKFAEFMAGRQGQHARAHLDYIKNSAQGRENAKTLYASSKEGVSADDWEKQRQNARYSLVAGKDGKSYSVVGANGATQFLTAGGLANTEPEILENVKDTGADRKDALVGAYKAQVANMGQVQELNDDGSVKVTRDRTLVDNGVRLNNDRIKGATRNLTSINGNRSAAGSAIRRDAMADMLANNQITQRALFDVDEKGRFTGEDASRVMNRGDYRGLVTSSLAGVNSADPAEVAKHLNVLSSLAEAAGTSGGEALTEFTDAVSQNVEGLRSLHLAYENSSETQRAALSGAMRRAGSESEMADQKQKSVSGGGTLTAQEQKRKALRGDLTTKVPRPGVSNEEQKIDRAAIAFARRMFHGRGDRG
jgi:hypothetical protein